MELTIRSYSHNDKAPLLEIFRLNTPKFFAPAEAVDFEAFLDTEGDTYYVLELAGFIIGGVGFTINGNIGRIVWIFLDPDFTGEGHGRTAVEYCIQQLDDSIDCQQIVVRTSQWAHRFFEKFGFQITHFEQDFWGEGLDLFEMERMHGKA